MPRNLERGTLSWPLVAADQVWARGAAHAVLYVLLIGDLPSLAMGERPEGLNI